MDLRNSRNTGRGKSLCSFRQQTFNLCGFIILSLLVSPTLSSEMHVCGDISDDSNCQCWPGLSEVRIMCPKPAPNSENAKLKIIMPIGPESSVTIECSGMNVREYKLMPEMDIGPKKTVKIRKCPLPGDTPISRVFEELGITNTTTFFFESDDFGMNLTRHHLSGLQNLQRLHLKSKDLAHLPDDVFMDLKDLNWLEFRAYSIELPRDLFAPLENLEFLELANNNLTHLPPGIFRNQGKLKSLNLWGNRLRNFEKESFDGLKNLTELDLSLNGLETLDASIFDLLPNLGNIHLSSNIFHQLPKGLFANTKNLSHFRLGYNKVPLVTLPEGLFSNLPKLEEIRITCGLQSLPGNLFANSTNIVNISFKNNDLSTLPEALLSNQSRLRNLELNNNQITELPDHLFRNNAQLKILNLSNNQLKHISRYIFSSLGNLEELYLDNNYLSSIDTNAFLTPQSLITLHLQNNFIEISQLILYESSSPFHMLQRLQVLNLRNNSITYLFNDWKNTLLGLRTLDLSYNKIPWLDHTDLQYLSQNRLVVNITHNEIKKIYISNESLINRRNEDSLLTLDINNNPLNCDCVLPNFVQFLQKSNPDQNKNIKIIANNLTCNEPENLHGTTVSALSVMDLLCPFDHPDTGKPLCPNKCKCSLRTFDNTLLVDCSNGNRLEIPKLPDIRSTRLVAIELNMTNNNLIKLPSGNESGYAQVVKLMLSGNNLTKFDATRLPRNLTHLDLQHNQLQLINESVITFLNESLSFVSLQLSNNPWLCNCEMKPLLTFMQIKYHIITDLSLMQCAAPLKDKFFQDLLIADICPEDESLVIFLAIVIALFGFLIGLTAALYYKYQKEIKIWLYAHNMFLWFVTVEDLDKDKLYDAFVSYSTLDEAFILHQLVPKLEQSNPKFRLCVHSRDWPVGDSIPSQIANSVENSRRTIILLSKNFLESVWALLEFRVAHRSSLTEKRTRLIVIVYGDIGDKDKLDSELKAYINTNTYLEWGDPWFWEKLRYAMPHQSPKINGLNKNQLKSAIDDKLELINPSPVTPPLTTPPAEATKNPLIAHLNGGTPQTAIMIPNGKTGQKPPYYMNGKSQNGHINGAFIINPNAKQSDV